MTPGKHCPRRFALANSASSITLASAVFRERVRSRARECLQIHGHIARGVRRLRAPGCRSCHLFPRGRRGRRGENAGTVSIWRYEKSVNEGSSLPAFDSKRGGLQRPTTAHRFGQDALWGQRELKRHARGPWLLMRILSIVTKSET